MSASRRSHRVTSARQLKSSPASRGSAMTIVRVEKSATETAGETAPRIRLEPTVVRPRRLARMRGTPCSTFLNPRDLIFVKSAPLTHLALLFTSYQIYALQLPSLEHFWKQRATLLDSPQRHWHLPSISPCRLHCGGACRALQQPPAASSSPCDPTAVGPLPQRQEKLASTERWAQQTPMEAAMPTATSVSAQMDTTSFPTISHSHSCRARSRHVPCVAAKRYVP